jgi:hypothetical protein
MLVLHFGIESAKYWSSLTCSIRSSAAGDLLPHSDVASALVGYFNATKPE